MSNLLIMVSVLLGAVTMVYLMKNPAPKGEPYSRKQKLMMIPFFLSVCCFLAATFLLYVRP
jgi:hypothetical protein